MHVLLIDDDPDIRLLAGFVLEAARHRVTVAESGAAGIAAAHEPFDIVLLDFRLGDMTGAEVLPALLKADPARPVVFLTGADDAATSAALIEAGASAVMTKPFDPGRLSAELEGVHARARSR